MTTRKLLMDYVAVGGAGFFGAIARFFVGRLFPFTAFPVGTLVINISGSLFLGWFLTVAGTRFPMSESTRLAVGVGFVGAYTTFSTYMFDANRMLSDGQAWRSILYIAGSVVLGLMAVRFGVIMGHWMGG